MLSVMPVRHASRVHRGGDGLTRSFHCSLLLQSLCNACGIRYKKEERRRRTSAAGTLDRRAPPQQQWGCYGPGAGKSAASYGMYDGDVGVVAVDGPCLSWMLEVVPSSPAFAARERRTLSPYY
jgi:hypothetical protein